MLTFSFRAYLHLLLIVLFGWVACSSPKLKEETVIKTKAKKYKNYEGFWALVDSLHDQGLFGSAYAELQKIQKESLKADEEEVYLRSWIKYQAIAQKENRDYPDAFLEKLALESKQQSGYRWFFTALHFDVLQTFYNRWSWKINNNLPRQTDEWVSFKEWTQSEYHAAFDSLMSLCLQLSIPLRQQKPIDFGVYYSGNSNKHAWENRQQPYLFWLYQNLGYRGLPRSEYWMLARPSDFVKYPVDSIITANKHNWTRNQPYYLIYCLQQIEKSYQQANQTENLLGFCTYRLSILASLQYKSESIIEKERISFVEKTLLDLITSHQKTPYYGLPLIAYLKHLQLLSPDSLFTYRKTAVKWANSYCNEYPNERYCNDMRLFLKSMYQKEMKVLTAQTILAGQKIPIRVESRNMDTLYYKFIPVETQLYGSFNKDEYKEKLLKDTSIWQQIALVNDQHYYTQHADLLLNSQTQGMYLICFSSLPSIDSSAVTEQKIITVSKYKVMAGLSVEGPQLITCHAVEAMNGKELIEAKIKVWVRIEDSWKEWQSGKTNNEGTFTFKNPSRAKNTLFTPYKNFNPSYFKIEIETQKGADEVIITHPAQYIEESEKNVAQKNIRIFTDRSLYRPGQEVLFKGIITSEKFHETEAKVLKNEKITCYLLQGMWGEKLDSIQLTSNEMGSFSGAFNLKNNLLPERYCIKTQYGNECFRVEAYKKPSYDLQFVEPDSTAKLGQDVRIGIRTNYYSGAVPQGTRIEYDISTFSHSPWMGRFSTYTQVREIAKGVAITNAKGQADITFFAAPDSFLKANKAPQILRYNVRVIAIDASGERNTQTFYFELSNASRRIAINMHDNKVYKQGEDIPIAVTHIGIGGKQIPAEGILQIEKLKSPQQSFIPFPFGMGTKIDKMFDKDSFARYLPHVAYYQAFAIEDLAVETVLRTEKIQTNRQKMTYKADDFSPQKGGYYRVWTQFEEKIGDSTYRFYEVAYFTVLHTKEMIGLPGTGLEVMPMSNNSNQVYPTATELSFMVQTGFADFSRVYYTLSNYKGIVAQGSKMLSKGAAILKLKTGTEEGVVYNCKITGYFQGKAMSKDFYFTTQRTYQKMELNPLFVRAFTEPGAKENWRFQLLKEGKPYTDAEALISMYDKSLDAIYSQSWSRRRALDLYPLSFQYTVSQQYNFNFSLLPSPPNRFSIPKSAFFYPHFHSLHWFYPLDVFSGYQPGVAYYLDNNNTQYAWGYGSDDDEDAYGEVAALSSMDGFRGVRKMKSVTISNMPNRMSSENEGFAFDALDEDEEEETEIQTTESGNNVGSFARKDFRETAFFFPHQRPDNKGVVAIDFTMPDAVTTWKLRAMVHDKVMRQAYLETALVSQKEIMIQARLPRFVRTTDSIELGGLLTNLGNSKRKVWVEIQVKVAEDDNAPLLLNQKFEWDLLSQQSVYQPTYLTVPSQVNQLEISFAVFELNQKRMPFYLDKELHYLMVMPDYETVREGKSFGGLTDFTLPLPNTLDEGRRLQVHIEAGPLQSIMKALPSLVYFEHNCAEQIANRMYAAVLTSQLLAHTELQKMTTHTKTQSLQDTGALGKWLKNRTLTTGTLAHTPWSHRKESYEKRQLDFLRLLEEKERVERIESDRSTLLGMQLSDGSWPWFVAFPTGNEQITYEVLLGFDRKQQWMPLQKSEVKAVERAMFYLFDKVKNEKKADAILLTPHQFRLLDVMSRFKGIIPDTSHAIQHAVLMAQQTLRKGIDIDRAATLTLALYGLGYADKFDALLLQRITENAIEIEQRGVTWQFDAANTYYGLQHAVEKQALLVEALRVLGKPQHQKLTEKAAMFLLTMRKGNAFEGSKAAAKALHELSKYYTLAQGGEKVPDIMIGNKAIDAKDDLAKWGELTLYFNADQIPQEVRVITHGRPVWVSSTWEATKPVTSAPLLDKFSPPFSLQTKYFKSLQNEGKEQLIPLHDTAVLNKGDVLCVVMDVRVRDYAEFMHLRYARPCMLEPVQRLSSYEYADGLSYYRAHTDAHTDFYIGSMQPGVYKLKVYFSVGQSGTSLGGLTTLQHMYLPEWSTYDKAHKIKAR